VGRHSGQRSPGPIAVLLDLASHGGAVVWRSLFATAAGLCFAAGVLQALGRVGDAYSLVLVAGALGAVGSLLGLLALRTEPSTDPYDPTATETPS
jgi:hypothetical protein